MSAHLPDALRVAPTLTRDGALEKGGREAASLGYVPLPASLVGQVKDYWSKSFRAGS